MLILLTIIHVIVCIFLIIVVLLQSGKAADLAGPRYDNHYVLRAAESRRRSHLFGNGDRGA